MSREQEAGSGSYGRVNGAVLRWIAGAVSIAVLGAAGLFVSGIARDVDVTATKAADLGERTAKMEAVLPMINDRLAGIEAKLDGVLAARTPALQPYFAVPRPSSTGAEAGAMVPRPSSSGALPAAPP